jgi:hypothetical protein
MRPLVGGETEVRFGQRDENPPGLAATAKTRFKLGRGLDEGEANVVRLASSLRR